MLGSLKKLSKGLVETAKNSVNFAQQKTSVIKAYYELGNSVIEEYKNNDFELSPKLKAEADALIKLVKESEIELLDANVLESIKELKENSKKIDKAETEETTEKAETKEEVKEETSKKTTASKKASKEETPKK